MTLALRYAVRSDVGLLREGNEDSAYAGPHLLAVADGMGGYEAGEVASAAVISSVAPLDRRAMPESELIDALAAAVTTAKQTLRRIVDADPAVGSMGTTLTAMLWAGGSAAICHIGDSRAYLVRDGDLYQITHDHTFVQALIDQGRIRPEEASTHPQRSLLLRALDGRTDADPDLSMLTAQAGDRYLICSDGLPVAVTDDQILQSLIATPEPTDAVLALIDLAIRGGAPDNVTCIVADVIDPDATGVPPTRAPVVVGAAASAENHDTKPFTRPAMDGPGPGITTLETIPATARARDTMPEQARPRQGQAPAAPSGRHAAVIASVDDDDEDEDEVLPRRRRWPVMTSILALFVLLIGGGVFFGHQYLNSQYYVGTSDGKVAIFRGTRPAAVRALAVERLPEDRHPGSGHPVPGCAGHQAGLVRQPGPGLDPGDQHPQELPGLPGRARGGQAVGGRQAQAGQGQGQGGERQDRVQDRHAEVPAQAADPGRLPGAAGQRDLSQDPARR